MAIGFPVSPGGAQASHAAAWVWARTQFSTAIGSHPTTSHPMPLFGFSGVLPRAKAPRCHGFSSAHGVEIFTRFSYGGARANAYPSAGSALRPFTVQPGNPSRPGDFVGLEHSFRFRDNPIIGVNLELASPAKRLLAQGLSMPGPFRRGWFIMLFGPPLFTGG